MKKFLLVILTCFITTALLVGCSDDSDDNKDSKPTIDELKKIQGTYNIEFFYTDSKILALTTDCAKVAEYVGENARKCQTNNDSVEHQGQATIQVNDNGDIKVLSKIQINGAIFNNSIIASQASDKTYNFTEYKTIPYSAITKNQINDNSTNNQVTGTSGRSANKLSNEKSEGNTYYFTIENDGIIVNKLVDVTVMPADTVVRMKKVDDNIITLNPNEKYTTPDIDNFDNEDVIYELKNN